MSSAVDHRFRTSIFKGSDEPASMAQVIAIRTQAFIVEQGMSADHDPDELDPTSVHILLHDSENGDLAVATCRIMPFAGEKSTGRIGRVAVKESHRGYGLGLQLIKLAVAEARRLGYEGAVILGQSRLEAFYQKAGFETEGEEFWSNNRPHRRLRMAF